MSKKKVEFSSEEISLIYGMLHLAGFREKREWALSLKSNRTEMQKSMGKIMKKLRTTNYLSS